ncbi:uncharacterized protein LOC121800878 [Salvia splendens]|uniref:uncharacterized protein LOC121800878 n=1 Tax=Salvia splendens TaxID=180675 RepID=UPI001C26FC50|nr:uncharacterized protein LOC121800878 [Salvia splendens]
MWVRHHLFLQEVERCWREGTGTSGMINVQIKLSRLKRSLRIWNRVVFGNIFERLKKAELEAKEALERYEQNPLPELRSEMNKSAAEFLLRLKMEEDFWHQKAALKCMAEGDRNTRFFQGWVKQKWVKSRILSIEDGNQTLTEDVDIRSSAEKFFKGLLSDDVGFLEELDLEILPTLPSQVNMEFFERAPTIDEIRKTVFSINAESAAGPDGYSALFFQACWEIMGADVAAAVLDLFAGSQIPRGIAATLIVLVPKKENPTKLAEFRPISLCNVMNKIISKLLASRMAPLLPLIIAPNQSGFIQGRLLSDNVLLAKEMFHKIWKGVASPNMVLKLDMEKAYDRVQWPFLLKVLRKMGFSDRWAQSSAILEVKECLNHYMVVSGQKVNVGKSCFFLDKKHIAWAREVKEVLDPTKGALRQIEQVMARFLWGSCNSSKKTHWIKWQRVCLPTDERGLGIRSLADSVEAFSIKMWWCFREQDSLWARYMFQKYCSISFPIVMYRSNRFSPMWRRLFKVGNICPEQVRWVLGDGNINVWYDSWVLNTPLASLCSSSPTYPSLKVNELWAGEQWDEEKVRLLVEEEGFPEEIAEKILQTPFDRGARDRGRWKLSGNGDFSLASAWELVRNRAGKRLIFEMIWGKNIGLSISMFLWRLLANRIPVDAKMQWRGISLASKCRCCEKPQVESRLHLFVNGEAARRVWQHFVRWFPQVPPFMEEGENIELRFRWWQRHLGIRAGYHLCTIIPCLILWFIWSERNENVHREKVFEVENVIRRVTSHLRNLILAKVLDPESWENCYP